MHLVDVLTVGDGVQSFGDASGDGQLFLCKVCCLSFLLRCIMYFSFLSGMYLKSTPPLSSNINSQGTLLQVR